MGISFVEGFDKLADNVEKFVLGNHETVRMALLCLFAEGHLLIEGVPGVAKTSLAKAIARSIDADHSRIQFTPDLLPADVTGGRIYRQDTGGFRFEPGPVFTHVLLADEINRSSPRTQSALLEVMAERQVTVDGRTFGVPEPFLCIATQNPIEHRGTFPLPEAQIDRFMMKITMLPPEPAAELKVLRGGIDRKTPESLAAALTLDQVKDMIEQVRAVEVSDAVLAYILALVTATRDPAAELEAGLSPRAGIALALAAQAHAKAEGRDYTCGDDVKKVAPPVLRHRLQPVPGAAERDPDAVIAKLLHTLPAPDHQAGARETKQDPGPAAAPTPVPAPVPGRGPVPEP